MNLNATVAAIMTRSVLTISVNEPLHKAREIMMRHHIRHLPVMQSDKLVGILSRTDINRLSFGMQYAGEDEADNAILDMLTIEQVMASNVRSIDVNCTIAETAKIFISEEFHALPVVNGNQLEGIVTTTDLIRYMLYYQC